MVFADFINWAMEQAGITNYKLAKRLGISQTTVANWANGITEPRERRRSEVLDLFGVDEADLDMGFPKIHYSEEKEKPPAHSEELLKDEVLKTVRETDDEEMLLEIMALVAERLKEKRGK